MKPRRRDCVEEVYRPEGYDFSGTATLKLTLLGAPRVNHGRATLRLPRQKSLALLVHLAGTGREQSRQKLMALLWPGFGDAQARQALGTALADIRRALGDDHLTADADAKKTMASRVQDGQLRPLGVGPLKRARQLEGLALLGITLQFAQGTAFASAWKFVA